MFGFFEKKLPAGTETIVLNLSGMHCTSCAVNIDLALEELPGVIGSRTNYPKSQTRVDFDPEKIKMKQIVAEIEKLGYKVTKI